MRDVCYETVDKKKVLHRARCCRKRLALEIARVRNTIRRLKQATWTEKGSSWRTLRRRAGCIVRGKRALGMKSLETVEREGENFLAREVSEIEDQNLMGDKA
jgi:hypothetical protein